MIALLKDGLTDERQELVHERFLAMLPRIRRQASLAFRHLGTEARHELTQETVAKRRDLTQENRDRPTVNAASKQPANPLKYSRPLHGCVTEIDNLPY